MKSPSVFAAASIFAALVAALRSRACRALRVFGVSLVIGVDRGAGADTLLAHGATFVVADLAELLA